MEEFDFSLKDFIQRQYETGKAGFGCSIESGQEYEEAVKICEELGIKYEVEADNPAEVWFQFVR